MVVSTGSLLAAIGNIEFQMLKRCSSRILRLCNTLGNMTHRYGWGGEVQDGSAGQTSHLYFTYSNGKNQRTDAGFIYDLAGNLTSDGAQTYTYDAQGQQATASGTGYSLTQNYDGDALRTSKTENGTTTYYLRSTILGGQVVCEINSSGGWSRGYVYSGSDLVAVQQQGGVFWNHEDAFAKSRRTTDSTGAVVSSIEPDPWG